MSNSSAQAVPGLEAETVPGPTSLAGVPAYRLHSHQFGIPAEQASDAFFLHDLQGCYLDVNQQACEMLGYTREELLRMSVFDVSVDHNLESAQAIWSQIQPGKTVVIKSHERRKDGSVFPMEARLSGYRVKGQTFILALIRDVSEQQRVEQIARASQDQYRVLFDSIDEGFCVIEMVYDAQGNPIDYRFLEVNPAFEKHVGLLGAAGHTIRSLVPNFESSFVDTYHRIAATGQPARFVEQSPSLGRSFDVYAFRVGQPEQARVAVLFSNITDRINTEKALIKSEKLAVVGLLTGVISHEIRNPLEAIDNLLFLASEEKDPHTIHDYIRTAQGELRRVANIVTHTLHFNRHSDVPAPDRLSQLLESAVSVYESRIRQSGVNLYRDYDPNDTISCLGSELRQVFTNLVVNAFEATLEGGIVTLKTRACPGWKTGEPGVRVTVADTGHGMDEKTRRHLFEAFYTTKATQGTGLGLWVSREILTRHNAHVSVRSRQTPNANGTVFHLWFPLTFRGAHKGHATPFDAPSQ